MKTQNEIRNGVVLSYLLIFINMLYGLLITPFILKHVGNMDYGVYKSISSLSASLAVLDLGLGSTMTRYMSKYHAEEDTKKANNFAAMIFIQYFIIVSVIAIVGVCIFFSLNTIYDESFSEQSLSLARRLLVFLIFNMVLRLFENLLTGIAGGFEHFTVTNGVRIVSVFVKIVLIGVFLPMTHNIIMIVVFESMITLSAIVILLYYIFRKIGIVPKLVEWDRKLFRESFGYTILMFLQTLTVQFNGNVDNVLIGAQMGAASVTVYSMALQLFGMYETLSGSVANIMLPNMAKRIAQGQTSEELQKGVEKAGRMQFLVLGAALGGFVVLGQDFFNLWLGKDYKECYYITLLLIIPVTFTMVQNVSLSILRAQNKMVYRTVTLLISCTINVIITFVGIKYIGYWGAALGTATSTIVNLILMNTYYHTKLNFRIISLFAHIMGRILPCATAATVTTYFLHIWLNGTWLSFIINVAVYIVIYAQLLFAWGLNKDEKELIIGYMIVRRHSK